MSTVLPDYSVVVPSYRRGALIEKTLRSLSAQDVAPREVIIVNDGGFDETTAYVRSRYPDFKVLEIPHSGAATARNTGVEAARCDLVLLIDDDDELRPEGARILLEAIQSFPDAHSAHGDSSYTNLNTGLHQENHYTDDASMRDRLAAVSPTKRVGSIRLYGRNLYYAMLKGNLLQQPWLFRRQTYLALGGFRSGLVSADDWDIYLRFSRRYPIALTTELVGRHYTEPGRPHLTLDPRQRQGQMAAARLQLQLALPSDPRAALSLMRTLALHHKAIADECRSRSLTESWKQNRTSFLYWPFDLAVAGRIAIIQPVQAVVEFIRGRSE